MARWAYNNFLAAWSILSWREGIFYSFWVRRDSFWLGMLEEADRFSA